MKEQSDTLVTLIHDAAGQVGPVAGIDGEMMARRAIRHERTRRGVIGGAVAAALVVLGAAGVAWFTERPALPAFLPWVQASSEVRSDGLVFEVPDGFEEFNPVGDPMWGADPVVPDDDDMEEVAHAASWVAVAPTEDAPLAGEQAGNQVTEVDVPGAVAARWSWYEPQYGSGTGYWQQGPGDGDFVGELDVELDSGTVVRVTMSLTDDDTPQDTFEQLVRTVRVEKASAEPEDSTSTGQEDLPLLESADAPESWERDEFHGLTYAAPEDWAAADGASAEHPSDTLLLRRPDGKAELQLAVVDRLEYLELNDEAGPLPDFYGFELEGADVSTVLVEQSDGEYRAYIDVRATGGSSYTVNLFGFDGATGLDDDLAAVLGSLGFTEASGDGAPAYDELDPAGPLLQDPPSDWEPATFEGLDLTLPRELKSPEGSWGIWSSDSEDSWEELAITLWDVEGYDQPIHLADYGYRYEPSGTTRGVVTLGTDTDSVETETGEPGFLGTATFHLTADGRKAVELRYEGSGATEERWWQILASLDAAGFASP
ncbi:hypothetical protein ACFWEJ_12565 [Promicromonospora sp. NPDC060204]|uniref:hypothetical protein n=1 Tax=Promicromonospora sp. NPDC060204 TaxID=3347071 RepID=UPI00364D644A